MCLQLLFILRHKLSRMHELLVLSLANTNPFSFVEAIRTSIKFAGPANYCPVLVGALAGARWGANTIDAKLLGMYE